MGGSRQKRQDEKVSAQGRRSVQGKRHRSARGILEITHMSRESTLSRENIMSRESTMSRRNIMSHPSTMSRKNTMSPPGTALP